MTPHNPYYQTQTQEERAFLDALFKDGLGFTVRSTGMYRDGPGDDGRGINRDSESQHHTSAECVFAAEILRHAHTRQSLILDIGSYVHFIIGLLAFYDVTSLDVRPRRRPAQEGEILLTADAAKEIQARDDHFDAVVTLCALEHFGLGRYGDDLDMAADSKAMNEIRRVLRPGGSLVLTTTVAPSPTLYFNAHRVYDLGMIHAFARGFEIIEEKAYSLERRSFIPIGEADAAQGFDIYCGHWRKVPA